MDDKPVVPLVIAAIICPICLLFILAPAFLGGAYVTYYWGFPLFAFGLSALLAITAVWILVRRLVLVFRGDTRPAKLPGQDPTVEA